VQVDGQEVELMILSPIWLREKIATGSSSRTSQMKLLVAAHEVRRRPLLAPSNFKVKQRSAAMFCWTFAHDSFCVISGSIMASLLHQRNRRLTSEQFPPSFVPDVQYSPGAFAKSENDPWEAKNIK